MSLSVAHIEETPGYQVNDPIDSQAWTQAAETADVTLEQSDVVAPASLRTQVPKQSRIPNLLTSIGLFGSIVAAGIMFMSMFGSADASVTRPRYGEDIKSTPWTPYKSLDHNHLIIGKMPEHGDAYLRQVGLDDIKFLGDGRSLNLMGKILEPTNGAIADENSYHLYVPRKEAVIPCNDKYDFCHVGVVSDAFPYCMPEVDETGQRRCAPINSGVSLVRQIFAPDIEGDESIIAEIEFDTPINADDPGHPIVLEDIANNSPAQIERLERRGIFGFFGDSATRRPPMVETVDFAKRDGTQKIPLPVERLEPYHLWGMERFRLRRKANAFDYAVAKVSDTVDVIEEKYPQWLDEAQERVKDGAQFIVKNIKKVVSNDSSSVGPSLIGISFCIMLLAAVGNFF